MFFYPGYFNPMYFVFALPALLLAMYAQWRVKSAYAKYSPMRARTALVPVAGLGSNLGYILFILGFFIHAFGLATLGLLLFSAAALFAAVTLPVEFNASNRAMHLLEENGLVTVQDAGMARKVLDAAALTYVAGLAQALSQVLYFAFLLAGLRRRED